MSLDALAVVYPRVLLLSFLSSRKQTKVGRVGWLDVLVLVDVGGAERASQ